MWSSSTTRETLNQENVISCSAADCLPFYSPFQCRENRVRAREWALFYSLIFEKMDRPRCAEMPDPRRSPREGSSSHPTATTVCSCSYGTGLHTGISDSAAPEDLVSQSVIIFFFNSISHLLTFLQVHPPGRSLSYMKPLFRGYEMCRFSRSDYVAERPSTGILN